MDRRTQPRHQAVVTVAELIKGLGLLPKYVQDSIGRVAAIEPSGEWMGTEVMPCPPFVLV